VKEELGLKDGGFVRVRENEFPVNGLRIAFRVVN
jgi:hypothetical protein